MAALPYAQGSRRSAPPARRTERKGRRGLPALLAFGLGLLCVGPLAADPAPRAVVVELFTSQGCYSCPPAEAFLGELARRDDVIALEFHVDYWNDLVYGAAGRWADPFSDPLYSDRQRRYARQISPGRVYTPQMVIDGAAEHVGSRREGVLAAIAAAKESGPRPLALRFAAADGGLAVTLEGDYGRPGDVWLVTFRRAQVTAVTAGENKGKTLTNHHIVTGLKRIGAWRGETTTITLPGDRPNPDGGCAVLVQNANLGPILGAAACPVASS